MFRLRIILYNLLLYQIILMSFFVKRRRFSMIIFNEKILETIRLLANDAKRNSTYVRGMCYIIVFKKKI